MFVFSGCVAKCVKVPLGCLLLAFYKSPVVDGWPTVIRAGKDSQSQLLEIKIRSRRRLCSTHGAVVVGVAHGELVVVSLEGLQSLGLNLDSKVNVTRCVGIPLGYNLGI